MFTSPIAFLSQGKLHLRASSGDMRTIESVFGRNLRDRAAQIQNRHAWKTQGRGAQFMTGMLWPNKTEDAAGFRISITSITRGQNPGELLYSLETDDVGGVFAVDAQGVEKRIFHTADFRIRHLALSHNRHEVASSIFHNDFTSNLAVLDLEGSGLTEVTEGDSLDLAPQWVQGSARRLVYQSAGIGRNAAGNFAGVGPFAVHELDLDAGDIRTLAEDAKLDFLNPRVGADGTLYCIQRPHESLIRKTNPLSALKDAVLFPFRLSYALFQYFNFFSMRYSGKPLITKQGAKQRDPDLKQMMIWGNLMEAGAHGSGDDAKDQEWVPASWQLVRRTANQSSEVLAKNVLSFDLTADGSIFYSNGSAIFHIPPQGNRGTKIHDAKMIEQVVALS